MRKITLYSKPNCPLCDQARYLLKRLLPSYGGAAAWELEEVNIIEDADLYRRYRYVIPVLDVEGIGPLPAPASLDERMVRRALETPPQGDMALQTEASTLLQSGQIEAETTSLENAIRANKPVPSAEEEQRHELYEELAETLEAPLAGLVNTLDAPLEALAGTVASHEAATEDAVQPPVFSGAPTPYQPQPQQHPQRTMVYGQRPVDRGPLGFLDQPSSWMGKRWVLLVNAVVGTFAIAPWLAPVFAKLGWWGGANFIYTFYMFFCHQLPERTYLVFGYEVAQCERCDALYGTIFLGGLLYGYARNHPGRLSWLLKPLPWQFFVLAMLPIGVDGLSHMLGFRETNAWFDTLTGGAFGSFSVGDAVGTLNWWLRIISGAIFGFAIVWLVFPWVERGVRDSANPYGRHYYPPPAPVALAIQVLFWTSATAFALAGIGILA